MYALLKANIDKVELAQNAKLSATRLIYKRPEVNKATWELHYTSSAIIIYE